MASCIADCDCEEALRRTLNAVQNETSELQRAGTFSRYCSCCQGALRVQAEATGGTVEDARRLVAERMKQQSINRMLASPHARN